MLLDLNYVYENIDTYQKTRQIIKTFNIHKHLDIISERNGEYH